MKYPEISEPAATHAAKDDELGVGAVRVRAAHGRMGLTSWWGCSKTGGSFPLKLVRVVAHFQGEQIVQISVNGTKVMCEKLVKR